MRKFISILFCSYGLLIFAQEKYYFPPELIKQHKIYKIRAYEMFTDSVLNEYKLKDEKQVGKMKYEEFTDIYFDNKGYRVKSQRFIASRKENNKLYIQSF